MLLKMEGALTLPDQLVGEILPLAVPVGDFAWELRQRTIGAKLEYTMTTCYDWRGKLLNEVPELVGQIGLNENQLEKFLNSTDFYNDREHLRNKLVLLPSRWAVRALLQASCLLKGTTNLFHEVGTELAALCECLRFLLTFTKQCKHSNEWRCHQFVEGIRDVPIKALDAVNCADKDSLLSSEMQIFEEHELLDPNVICDSAEVVKEIWVEKMAKTFFDAKNGKRLALLDTLGMLHSFKEEIDATLGKLGRKDLQSHNA